MGTRHFLIQRQHETWSLSQIWNIYGQKRNVHLNRQKLKKRPQSHRSHLPSYFLNGILKWVRRTCSIQTVFWLSVISNLTPSSSLTNTISLKSIGLVVVKGLWQELIWFIWKIIHETICVRHPSSMLRTYLQRNWASKVSITLPNQLKWLLSRVMQK